MPCPAAPNQQGELHDLVYLVGRALFFVAVKHFLASIWKEFTRAQNIWGEKKNICFFPWRKESCSKLLVVARRDCKRWVCGYLPVVTDYMDRAVSAVFVVGVPNGAQLAAAALPPAGWNFSHGHVVVIAFVVFCGHFNHALDAHMGDLRWKKQVSLVFDNRK